MTSPRRQNGFSPLIILLVIGVALVAGIGIFFSLQATAPTRTIPPLPIPVACTEEAKLCPDGSAVGRTGPNCEFAPCPANTGLSCTSDANCPSSKYACEAIEGMGVVYPNNGKPPETTIIKGICKLKAGNACKTDADCISGLLCHAGACTSPRGNACSGKGDTSCASGYTCVQACGPPIARIGDQPPPWYCELNEAASKPRMCPICLASNTVISARGGNVNVKDIRVGDRVWSVDRRGQKVLSNVIKITRSETPKTHRVVHLVLNDSRQLWVSPNHPTADGRRAWDLRPDETYDGGVIVTAESVQYWDTQTFDILPDSETGFYWANGILMGSTLKRS